jgi:HD-GYP domain-containing protein (c-di-GMP phosphodiesterase class II)
MRLTATASVVPGTELARDVTVSPRPGHLLCSGVVVDGRLLEALLENGITRVWVKDELSEGIDPAPVLGPRLRDEAIAHVARLHADARRALLTRRPRLDEGLLAALHRLAERIADDAIEASGRPGDLLDLAAAPRYALNHPVDTAALAILVAIRHMRTAGWRQGTGRRRFDAPRSELARLGLGVLLCDVGMLALPRTVLDDPGPLAEEDLEQVRAHPLIGAELLGGNTSFVLKSIVRGHHERWDGLGYPDGHAGPAIQRFARYAAVADAYDAMTAERVHRPAMSPADAWAEIVAGGGIAYDPEVVEAFACAVPRHPPGTEVTLADGRTAVVADVELDAPDNPTVRVREGAAVVEVRAAELAAA